MIPSTSTRLPEGRSPRARFLFGQGLKLLVASACLVGSIAAWRLLLHPAIASALSLGDAAASVLRRLGIFASAVLAYSAFVRFYERRRPAAELTVRVPWTIVAGAAGALSIGVTILILYAAGHYQLVGVRGFGGTPGTLAVIAIAAVLEELAFRAILFRVLEETFGTTAALLVSAMGFCVVHLSNNGVHAITPLTTTLAGLMWAGLFIVWRNVWVAAAHHGCWNATIFLIGVPLSGEDWRALAPWQTEVHGSVFWTGGDFGPEDSLITTALMIAVCAVLIRIGRRRGRWVASPIVSDRTRSGPAPPAPAPTAHDASPEILSQH